MWVVVVPAMPAAAHPVVISTVVMRLRYSGNSGHRKEKCRNKNTLSEIANQRLYANSPAKSFKQY